MLAEGRDPKIEREQVRLAAKVKPAKLITSTIAHALYRPVIGALPVGEIDISLVLKVLQPIWRSSTVTDIRFSY